VRVVILSDIHGNIEALSSIPASFDEMWVLGDLVNYGPDPGVVVDFVRRHAAVVVRGNHDHAIGMGVDPRCSPAFREMASAMQVYTERVLSDEQKAYLRSLPLAARREVDGASFYLCHAAPSDPLYNYAPADPEFWNAETQSVKADVLLVGHTHLPSILHLGAWRVVNPGSVGQPKHGAPEARYAVCENGVVTLHASPYAVEDTVRKVLNLPVDATIRGQLAGVLRNGRPPV
jgi:putative phosphoesterase